MANPNTGHGAAATAHSGAMAAKPDKTRNVYSPKAAANHCKGAKGKTEPSRANGVKIQENHGIATILTSGLHNGKDANI